MAILETVDKQAYHNLSQGDAIALLESSLERGLCANEVAQRYEVFGWNELPAQKGQPAWMRFLLQFHEPLLYILLIAGAVKAALGSWINACVIWGVTLVNALIGYIQESKAEGAIASLAKTILTEATVLRDQQTLRIPSRDLVPGDIVLLTSGDKVPADLRLLRSRNLKIDESALTGESVPVDKSVGPVPPDTPLAERVNMAYAGSFVTFGQGHGLVVATAQTTEVGKISQSMQGRVNLTTPLTRKFAKFSRTLLYCVLTLATVTFTIGLGQGESWSNMFEAAVALAVSAIPEGLPAVVTITLAIGVNRMARRHTIIRKLPAVEALGSATVVCSDKTGTLTENQMTVQAVYAGQRHYRVTGGGYSPEGEFFASADRTSLAQEDSNKENARKENDGKENDGKENDNTTENVVQKELTTALKNCLIAGALCNDAQLKQTGHHWSVVGDPTEGGLLTAAAKAELNQAALTKSWPRLDSIPFESQYQYMASLHAGQPQRIYIKGSVEALLARCSKMMAADGTVVPIASAAIEQAVEKMTQQALRVLAFAMKTTATHQHSIEHSDVEEGLIFLGLQGMIDPPRPEAIAAIKTCKRAGIQVKMITGDHISTARAIASNMSLQKATRVVAFEGKQLLTMDNSQLAQAVETGDVFARVAPEEKLRLVEALQSSGEVVAMTGDGVNDAPALKQADIGIAMGQGGTEVAREAADMLLTNDNFAAIEAAIEEGRTVYQNLRKAIAFLLPVNGGESMTILISALLARALPILSLQVLWLNMINSLTMTVPLAFEPKSEGIMQKSPRQPNEPLITKRLLRRILTVSVFNWILIFGMFEWAMAATADIAIARTMAIQSLVAARVVYLLSISQLGLSLARFVTRKTQNVTPAPILVAGIIAAILLQVLFSQWGLMNSLFQTAPLTWQQWLICLMPMIPMIPVAVFSNLIDPPA
ncbi:MAG: cation-transporting P-type ATPase [Cyanobacteria bacterium J06607_10]